MSETEVSTESQSVDMDDLDAFANDFFGEKPEAVTDAKPEADKDADTEGDSTTDAQKKTDVDPNEDPDAEFVEAPPKKKTVQDRIDELVRQREDQKRDAAREVAELRKEFEAQLAALKPQTAQSKTAEPTPEALNEDGSPKYALGEFDPMYIRDLTRFTLEQERNQANVRAEEQRRNQEQEAQSTALQSSWNEKLEAATVTYPDLREKGQVLLDGFQNLDPGYAGYLATVLMSMDFGPDVLNYLSDNPAEATKIVNSGATKATIALGRIESKFVEAEALKAVAKPKVSKAPPPPAATARGTGGGAKTVEPDTDNLDDFSAMFFAKKR